MFYGVVPVHKTYDRLFHGRESPYSIMYKIDCLIGLYVLYNCWDFFVMHNL